MCNYCNRIIWVDALRREACVNNFPVRVFSPEIILEQKADYYVVAVEDEKKAKEIIDILDHKYKIPQNRIIYQLLKITRY